MRRLSGQVHCENSNFFLFDDLFAAQASTIDGAAGFLQPGQGVLVITTEVRWGRMRRRRPRPGRPPGKLAEMRSSNHAVTTLVRVSVEPGPARR